MVVVVVGLRSRVDRSDWCFGGGTAARRQSLHHGSWQARDVVFVLQ